MFYATQRPLFCWRRRWRLMLAMYTVGFASVRKSRTYICTLNLAVLWGPWEEGPRGACSS